MNLTPAPETPSAHAGAGGSAHVRAENVTVSRGSRRVLNDVSVTVPTGVTGLLGPNGAGKSTFMKLITGQLKPSKGSVKVLGEPMEIPGIGRYVSFIDTEANRVSMLQPLRRSGRG